MKAATTGLEGWWSTFWFGETNPRLYAGLRIALGAVGCLSLLGLMPASEFWSCRGLVSSRYGVLCGPAIGPLASVVGPALLAACAGAFIVMALGVFTRVAVVAAFAALFVAARWNNLPLSSAHQVLRALIFCLIWADCGRVWSVDAWWRRRRGETGDGLVPIWPLRLFQIQVAAVYLITGLWKLANASWRDGSALHYVLQNAQFGRFSALTAPALDPWTTLATYATLAWELAFAVLVSLPRTRRWVLLSGVCLHLAMWAFLEIGSFSLVMIASYLAFVPPPSWLSRQRSGVVSRPE
jgi:hypothetical protein